ncbi:MAG: chorismate synthase [Lawsonibacter sp.]|nr:chorismate synthase [Lawsonibacter sp.]
MSSYLGKNLHISIFGQSHAPAIGVTMDGLPPGERVDLEALEAFLQRRAPGRDLTATTRKEGDNPQILCGLLDGVTCGAPLTAVIANTNTRSQDYAQLRDVPRPGHADYTASLRYGGFQDVRGGGHFSGRLTAPLCIAGGICLQILERRGIQIAAHIRSIFTTEDRPFHPMGEDADTLRRLKETPFPVLDSAKGEEMRLRILEAKNLQDSVGGVVECIVMHPPAGVGDPMFGGMEGRLACALFGIPAVKGVEFGAGFGAARLWGSQNNDPYTMEHGTVTLKSNHAGGILGGITNGMPLIFRAAFKPTPSIGLEQDSVSLSRRTAEKLTVHGRHDPCIVPRAVPVVEAAAAVVLLDAILDCGM